MRYNSSRNVSITKISFNKTLVQNVAMEEKLRLSQVLLINPGIPSNPFKKISRQYSAVHRHWEIYWKISAKSSGEISLLSTIYNNITFSNTTSYLLLRVFRIRFNINTNVRIRCFLICLIIMLGDEKFSFSLKAA